MSKVKYQSRYSPDKLVSAGQYITELICEKKARIDGKDLPVKFWNLPKWNAFYRQQIGSANSLLKKYEAAAIIRALQSSAAYNIFSLRAPQLDRIIQEEQRRLDIIKKNSELAVELKPADINAKPRQQQIKRTTLSKLRELDDGEEESS